MKRFWSWIALGILLAGGLWAYFKSSSQQARPVFVVGLDGADWSFLQPMLTAGQMPNLQLLRQEGEFGILLTEHPPLSPLLWTTMMTGVSPLQHQILDFARYNPDTGLQEPISSADRKAPAIWNIASAQGKSVAILGLWATWPAEPVQGLMVSDRLFSFQRAEKKTLPALVYPPEHEAGALALRKKIELELGFDEVQTYLPWLQPAEYELAVRAQDPYQSPVSSLRRILIETRLFHALALETFSKKPDLGVVYHQGTDALGHVFAAYTPPKLPSVSEEDYARYNQVPALYFQEMDQMLGEYMRLAKQMNASLLLVSDHGFRWNASRPEQLSAQAKGTAAQWHRDEGMYLFWRPGMVSGKQRQPGKIRQVTSTLLNLLDLPPGEGLAPALDILPASQKAALNYQAKFKPSTFTSSAIEDESLEMLHALGYLGESEPKQTTKTGVTRTAASYNNEGLILQNEGKRHDAVAAFEQALAIAPQHIASLWNLSELLWSDPDARERSNGLFLQAVQAGLDLGPEVVLKRVRQDSQNTKRVSAFLESALGHWPKSAALWQQRGKLRLQDGFCFDAMQDFLQATQLVPDDPVAHAALGLAALCLEQTDLAVRSLQRSLQLDPAQPEIRQALEQLGP